VGATRLEDYPRVRLQLGTLSPYPDAFRRSSGVPRLGEMVLVLDAHGSGRTTFLKVIANERNTYADLTENAGTGISLTQRCSGATMVMPYTTEKVGETAPYDTPLIPLTDDTCVPTLILGQTLASQ